MQKHDQHIANQIENGADFFDRVHISYPKTKEQVWTEMQLQIRNKQKKTAFYSIPLYVKRSVAAVIALLLILGIIAEFRVKTISADIAQTQTHTLPDGSVVLLNSESSIRYKPMLWFMSRTVTLSGEGFFSVRHGKTFTVNSNSGQTNVLGTKFNIYARNSVYRVTCVEGSVKVHNADRSKSVQLIHGSSVTFQANIEAEINQNIETDEATAWTEGKFSYTAAPLNVVFEEIERRYGISIRYEQKVEVKYSGNFDKPETPEQALEIICIPNGLRYTKIGPHEFQIRTLE